MENCLPFEGALGAHPVGEAFALMSLSIRYADYSVSDAQVEDKYSLDAQQPH